MARKNTNTGGRERYQLEQSPLSQRPTQRDVGNLVGETRDDLRWLVNHKEGFIVRRSVEIRNKMRDLAYPVSRLRTVHEKLKFHLNKIKQPDYLFSPRKGKTQRDNAAVHLGSAEFLTLDIKKFYPSTTEQMVQRWLVDGLKMYPDVASLITKLVTIDGVVSFGSPLTPVLCTLIHRAMFDEMASLCKSLGLQFSIWVDDIAISGSAIPSDVIPAIRQIIRLRGLKSHKIRIRHIKKPVFVTGIGVFHGLLVPRNSVNKNIKVLFEQFNQALTMDEKDDCSRQLLAALGTVRFISGSKSERGQIAANQMNSVRQQLQKFRRKDDELWVLKRKSYPKSGEQVPADLPFDL